MVATEASIHWVAWRYFRLSTGYHEVFNRLEWHRRHQRICCYLEKRRLSFLSGLSSSSLAPPTIASMFITCCWLQPANKFGRETQRAFKKELCYFLQHHNFKIPFYSNAFSNLRHAASNCIFFLVHSSSGFLLSRSTKKSYPRQWNNYSLHNTF